MSMPSITREQHTTALARVGDDAVLAEALGLVPYWGHDTNNRTGRGKAKPVPTLREPIVLDGVRVADRTWHCEHCHLDNRTPPGTTATDVVVCEHCNASSIIVEVIW